MQQTAPAIGIGRHASPAIACNGLRLSRRGRKSALSPEQPPQRLSVMADPRVSCVVQQASVAAAAETEGRVGS